MHMASTQKTRLPWRHRTKRKVYQRTATEKKILAEKRQKHKASYNEALYAAYAIVQVEALKFKEQFGAHSKKYYMEEIMQLSWLGRKNRRSINNWNIYLQNEVKHLNDGKLMFFGLRCLILIFTSFSAELPPGTQPGKHLHSWVRSLQNGTACQKKNRRLQHLMDMMILKDIMK